MSISNPKMARARRAFWSVSFVPARRVVESMIEVSTATITGRNKSRRTGAPPKKMPSVFLNSFQSFWSAAAQSGITNAAKARDSKNHAFKKIIDLHKEDPKISA